MAREKIIKWLPPIAISAAALISVMVFLTGTERGIPMGDSYIHFSYARNLALHHELSYNLGIEEGIGSTSFFWVVLLALGQLAGIAPETSAVVLGLVFLICSGNLFYLIIGNALIDLPAKKRIIFAGTAAICVVMPGSLIWLALSGMEALLFLCLALLSIRIYSLKRWALLGLVLGLLVLTRIEGLILAGSLGIIEVLHQRRIPRGIMISALVASVLVLPWLLYLFDRGGLFVTASYQGRKVMVAETNVRITQNPLIGWLISINPVVYGFSWTAFLLLYASGAAGIPGPEITTEQSILGTQIGFPLLGAAVAIACLVYLILGVRYLWRQRRKLSIGNPDQAPVVVLLVWITLHNLAYALFISQIGAAGRYAVLNQILFWAILFIGAGSLTKVIPRMISTFLVAGMLIGSLFYWRNVYRANITYSQQVRIAAAEYIDRTYPVDTPIGATDLGPIQYFARQPVVDLIGHVNQEVGPFHEQGGDYADYLLAKKLCYLMLFTNVGDAGVDFAQEMGFRSDDRFTLVSQAKFQVPLETWLTGSEPLRNYLPAVEVSRIDWNDPALCVMSEDLEGGHEK